MDIEVFKGDMLELMPAIESWWKQMLNMMDMDADPIRLLNHLRVLVDPMNADADVLVRRKEGKVVGFMGLVAIPSPFGSDRIVHEHLWYVMPGSRGLGVAERFIERAKEWGGARNCKFFSLTASKMAGTSIERICRMYERLGFKHYETSFITEI